MDSYTITISFDWLKPLFFGILVAIRFVLGLAVVSAVGGVVFLGLSGGLNFTPDLNQVDQKEVNGMVYSKIEVRIIPAEPLQFIGVKGWTETYYLKQDKAYKSDMGWYTEDGKDTYRYYTEWKNKQQKEQLVNMFNDSKQQTTKLPKTTLQLPEISAVPKH